MTYKPLLVLAALLLGVAGVVSARDARAGDVGDRVDHRLDG